MNKRKITRAYDQSTAVTVAGLIPIAIYASMHGLNPATVRQKCIRGGWRTAVKIGRDWFIDPDESHTDHRRKNDNKLT